MPPAGAQPMQQNYYPNTNIGYDVNANQGQQYYQNPENYVQGNIYQEPNTIDQQNNGQYDFGNEMPPNLQPDFNNFDYTNFDFQNNLPFTMTYDGCIHLKEYKLAHLDWMDTMTTIVRYGLVSYSQKYKSIQYPYPTCGYCLSSNSLIACVHCVFIGCWWTNNHIGVHYQYNMDHYLGIDIQRSQLYCSKCLDYIYDRDFDNLVKEEKMSAREAVLSSAGFFPERTKFSSWKPTEIEKTITEKNSAPLIATGLRGLYNLGSTCFMNSILQAFIHNPLLRAYFLADKHNRRECPRQAPDSTSKVCLACETDFLFSKVFNGETEAISPHSFLYSLWSYAQQLAGYEQQDAHEFFITLVNGLHTHCQGTLVNCDCIVHQIFSGTLRSDVTCENCSNVSTAHDPFFDISVDLSSSDATFFDQKNTLLECLKRYTSSEKLDSQDFRCEICSTTSGPVKQLRMKVLPCVLCVHLKRFEHTTTSNHKIDTFIEFPLKLDMAPFLYDSIQKEYESFLVSNEPTVSQEYDLFAVIIHVGTLESGHYVSYVLCKGEWFKIDDSLVTKASAIDVLQSKAYMLFYVKSNLDFMKRT